MVDAAATRRADRLQLMAMGERGNSIDPDLAAWIGRQRLFFVATAPSGGGHVNLSPKGLDTFAILDQRSVAYLDLTGSGVETIAHIRDNGRITVMFCAFEGPPKIVRLHGRGEVIESADPGFPELLSRFTPRPGARSVIRITLERVSDSCGYGVPTMEYLGERTQMAAWAEHKGEDGLRAYRAHKNARSIDGLPGLRHLDRVDEEAPA